LTRTVKGIAEESRVRVRACRRTAIENAKKLEKDAKISEDELTDSEADVQKLTDKAVAEIEKVVAAKEAELMKV
jgi:ribosome recycling factor